jgi:hypothetical protein
MALAYNFSRVLSIMGGGVFTGEGCGAKPPHPQHSQGRAANSFTASKRNPGYARSRFNNASSADNQWHTIGRVLFGILGSLFFLGRHNRLLLWFFVALSYLTHDLVPR